MIKRAHECSSVCPNFSECKVRLGLLADEDLDATGDRLRPYLDNRLPAIGTTRAPAHLTVVK